MSQRGAFLRHQAAAQQASVGLCRQGELDKGTQALQGCAVISVPVLRLHFAVYADGGICLDILQNQWSPIYDVSAILTSIQVAAGTAQRS